MSDKTNEKINDAPPSPAGAEISAGSAARAASAGGRNRPVSSRKEGRAAAHTPPGVLPDYGEPNEKQKLFFASTAPFTCYGGAKGGGKTWAVRVKAARAAAEEWPGIRILIMRAHYPELEMNHIRPMRAMIPESIGKYNAANHIITFENGSFIKFGHWAGDLSENEYNGQEYDWIFIDEATQFSERAFCFLCGCLRGTNGIPKRMYLTCNPGGIGHFWVKRLFIDRRYRTDSDNPELNEYPEDYNFIFATVEDNRAVLENSPEYLKALAKMPNARAYRYGDWDAIGGNYFGEFREETHMMPPFRIPPSWVRYRSFDYGLDMFACLWWAVDSDGRCWCCREFEQSNLIVQDAARAALSHTLPEEKILLTYAPPDMWSRQKDSGRTMAECFALCGLEIVPADNSRVQGHIMLKEMLAPVPLRDPYVISLFPEGKAPETLPGMMFFRGLEKVTEDLRSIQADSVDPNDCAKEPHEVTHTVDACRYLAVNRLISAEKDGALPSAYSPAGRKNYMDYMAGGEATADYLGW